MTITELCRSLGLNQETQRAAEAKLNSLGINLNNPNEVKSGINALIGRVRPFISVAMPFLRKASPKIKEVTGYSVDDLYSELTHVSADNPVKQHKQGAATDIYSKYDNL